MVWTELVSLNRFSGFCKVSNALHHGSKVRRDCFTNHFAFIDLPGFRVYVGTNIGNHFDPEIASAY